MEKENGLFLSTAIIKIQKRCNVISYCNVSELYVDWRVEGMQFIGGEELSGGKWRNTAHRNKEVFYFILFFFLCFADRASRYIYLSS